MDGSIHRFTTYRNESESVVPGQEELHLSFLHLVNVPGLTHLSTGNVPGRIGIAAPA